MVADNNLCLFFVVLLLWLQSKYTVLHFVIYAKKLLYNVLLLIICMY